MSEAGRRVLVVDDDPVLRRVAEASLSAAGFEVDSAEDGETALSAATASPPDLIVLDVEMPGLDGFATCLALRENPATAEVPVLVATGRTDHETIDRAFQVGATDFIAKPFDWQLLQHRVRFMMRATSAFSDLKRTLSRLTESEGRLAHAQRLARVGHWEWIFDDLTLYCSAEFYRLLERSAAADPLTLDDLFEATHPEDRSRLEKALRKAATEAKGWSFDQRLITPTGEERVVHHQAEVVLGPDGTPDRIAGAIQDITERRRAEERIQFLAHYDSLTALPNRKLLHQHLERLLSVEPPPGETTSILFLNLDRFNRVNETLGHAVGDELLRESADRLTQSVRTSDFVGSNVLVSRIGGDEFTVVVRSRHYFDGVAKVAQRLMEIMRQPFVVEGHELTMTVSIGIAICPDDGEDVDTLLRNADTALRHAKMQGRDSYEFFSNKMNEEITRKVRTEILLRKAIEAGTLDLHYQPQYFAAGRGLRGVEVLARWLEPEPIQPSEFIGVAEETGLIGPLGEWVLRQACGQIRAWRDQGLDDLRFAVNVSSAQLRRPGLVEIVRDALQRESIDPGNLELEITESALLWDEPHVLDTLSRLKETGVRLALDDFGTGYSSFTHLVRYPIDVIKIDQSFVSRIGRDRQGGAIIAAVTALAHELGLEVCAEGVETEEQEVFLQNLGCDLLQGYRLSRPLDAEQLAALLRGSSS